MTFGMTFPGLWRVRSCAACPGLGRCLFPGPDLPKGGAQVPRRMDTSPLGDLQSSLAVGRYLFEDIRQAARSQG